MEPTDTGKSDYFHKVVDCQWACPAHTDVPEYIRLIAQGQFTEAYMVNRESNVFPGILGRVCDRPCEPACRRGRIESKPVAICRLKRVAADQRDDVAALLPRAPRPQERQARGLHRRGTGLAHGGERSAAARVRGHDFRAVRRRRRPDAHQYSGVSTAGERARRGDRLHRRHGRRPQARHPSRACGDCSIPRNSMRCSSAPARPRARSSSCRAGMTAAACTSASPGSNRWRFSTSTRSASACSSSASAIPPWIAAAPRCVSAPRT